MNDSRITHRRFLRFRVFRVFRGLIPALLFSAVGRAQAEEWFDFNPPTDPFAAESVIDLRYLNENYAGEHGRIIAQGDHFAHADTGEPVRFWAMNMGHYAELNEHEWKHVARLLAKYGVNQVRLHGAIYKTDSNNRAADGSALPSPYDKLDSSPYKIAALQRAVAALKAEGIYSHISIHFPLWLQIPADHPKFPGYDNQTHAFAINFFHPRFQPYYDQWWRDLLTVENDYTGNRLIDEPALMSVELLNEDSFLFWTFNANAIPAESLTVLQHQFGDWLVERHGSLAEAQGAWGLDQPGDDWKTGRIMLRHHSAMMREQTARDRDTLRFLVETQRGWYDEKNALLRDLGFEGMINAGSWITADDRLYDGLERYTYLGGDFIDHHRGYFGGQLNGEHAAWSLRDGYTYFDRSLLRFDPQNPADSTDPDYDFILGKPTWNGKPTMLSETAWTRPNRFRAESTPLYAAYGALHDIDCLTHFHFVGDGTAWRVKPGYWMQLWPIMSPTGMGQFPAAALIYRQGLVRTGAPLVSADINLEQQLAFAGQPIYSRGGVDQLRQDPADPELEETDRDIDPLRLLMGRVEGNIGDAPAAVTLPDTDAYVHRAHSTVTSTTFELSVDWAHGVFVLNAPRAQGFAGATGNRPRWSTADLVFETESELINVLAVSLDGAPLRSSSRMLLQVMSEERHTGWSTEPVAGGAPGEKRIQSVGTDPWQIREFAGTLTFAGEPVTATRLDALGIPTGQVATATHSLELEPRTIYYLIER